MTVYDQNQTRKSFFFFTGIVSRFLVKFNPNFFLPFLFGLSWTFLFLLFLSRSLTNVLLLTVKCSFLIKSRKETDRTKEENGRGCYLRKVWISLLMLSLDLMKCKMTRAIEVYSDEQKYVYIVLRMFSRWCRAVDQFQLRTVVNPNESFVRI